MRNPQQKIVVYSGHDVSLLALLYALGVDLDCHYWPEYASTLSIELCDEGEMLVRVRQNGVECLPIMTLDSFERKCTENLLHPLGLRGQALS